MYFVEAALEEGVSSLTPESVEDKGRFSIKTHIEQIVFSSAEDALSIFFPN